MKKRPLSVTILAVILAVAGLVGLVYHLTEIKTFSPFPWEVLWVSVVRGIAIVAGVFMLRGRNWARWLAIAWIGFHVGISAFHTTRELIMHALLLAVFAYFLFRRAANFYFRSSLR
jgi:carbon starvation protein CstA